MHVEELFLDGFGHDITGLRGQTGAFKLHRGVFDMKVLCSDVFDRGEEAFALVHVHVGDARVKAESVVTAAERPDMDVVDLLDTFHGQDSSSDLFDLQIMWAAFQEQM